MGVYTRPDSPFYWLALERAGEKPLRVKTLIRKDAATPAMRQDNRALANVAYHAGMTELARGTYQPERQATPQLARYWTTVYLPWLEANYPNAVQETTRVIETLFIPTLGERQLSEIRPGLIKEWLDARTTVTPQSKARELSHLRGLLSRAVEWEHLAKHPLADLSLDAAPSQEIIRYLSADEHGRLMRAMGARDLEARAARERLNRHRAARRRAPLPALPTYADWMHPMIVLSLYTGMRRGEVFKAQWPAIDWTAKVITVEWWTAKRNRKRAIKSRRISLNKHAFGAVQAWHAQQGEPTEGLIFPSHTGQPFTNVDSSWGEIRERAGLVNFRWHDLRHTFASWLVQRGESLYVVQRLMGHGSIATTMKYAHLAPDQAHAAVESLES